MAVAPAIRVLQIFSGLGSIATVPFTVQFSNKKYIDELGGGDKRIVTGEEEVAEKKEKEANGGNEAMEKAIEMMVQDGEGGNKEDKRGCFWMPTLSLAELFFCFNINKLNSLFLFHYDRRSGNTLEERLNRIISISVPRPTNMNFFGGKSKPLNLRLKAPLAWMLRGETFVPSDSCSIEKHTNQKDYKLSCNTLSSGGKRGPWEQNISHDSVHIPELKLQKRIEN